MSDTTLLDCETELKRCLAPLPLGLGLVTSTGTNAKEKREREKKVKAVGKGRLGKNLLRIGDVVWNCAIGDEGNFGRSIWDGNFLIVCHFHSCIPFS